MTGLPKLPWLRALLATRDAGSMHRAARVLGRTQPSVSLAIASLESALGLPLVARSSTGAALTAEGRLLADRASRGIESMQRSAQAAGLGPAALARLLRTLRDGQWRALSATVAHSSIAAAARQLGVAAPVVSRAMSQFTHAAGRSLYRRVGNGVEPTQAARELAAGYELLQGELRQGLEQFRELRGLYDGQLRIGALPTARASWLPRSLEKLLLEHPDAVVSIMDGPYEEQLGALREGRIDLIMGALRHPSPGRDLVQETIFHDTLTLVGRSGHPMQRRRARGRMGIDRKALADYRWLLPPAGTPAREQLHRLLEANGLPAPARVLECNSFLTIRELLLHSDSIAVVSTSQVASDVVQSRLCIIGLDLPGTRHAVGWATRADFKPTELMRAYLKLARHPPIPPTHTYLSSV